MDKKELLRIATQLKELADRLLDQAKESPSKDVESKEPKSDDSPKHAMIGMLLKEKMKGK